MTFARKGQVKQLLPKEGAGGWSYSVVFPVNRSHFLNEVSADPPTVSASSIAMQMYYVSAGR